ncbi:MAG: hydrogenase, partial [Lentisphaeria bacterium]|nr:hydrogenase [Lentisphaeria bacterium]
MLKAFMARLRQGYRTGTFPATAPVLPDRFAGRPEVYPEKVTEEAKQICPVNAISENGKINL